MLKVDNKKAAWDLANRLFPTDYALDEERSKNAGYNIYHTTNTEMNAWISDLGDRLELNYPNGSSENIWIESDKPNDTVAVVGIYVEKKVFGDVKITEVQEVTYHHVQGLVNKTLDDGRFGIVLSLLNDETASFGCENVAYIRFLD